MLVDVEALELAVLADPQVPLAGDLLIKKNMIKAKPPTQTTHVMLPTNCAFSWSQPPP